MFKNIVFAGTPEIASNLLQNLVIHKYNILAVYTQPDRPKGRNLQLELSPVKQEAIKHNIPVIQPKSLKDIKVIEELQNLNPDLIIVFAYGLIFPKEILNIPKFGCFNVHTSLLPKYRGAAPIQHTILNGDHITGISIIKMDPGLDTGDIWYFNTCSVNNNDTTESLTEKLKPLATKAMLYVLQKFDQIKPIIQDSNLSSYAHKINKSDAKIDWGLPAESIERKIRAFIPAPIAFTEIKNNNFTKVNKNEFDENLYIQIRIWQAKIGSNVDNVNSIHNKYGKILNINKYGIEVMTGKGTLIIEKLQFPSGKILKIRELINSLKYKTFLEKSDFFY